MDSRKAQISTVLLSSFAQGLVGSAFPASAAVLRGRGLTDPQYGSIFLPQMVLATIGALGAGFVLDRFGAEWWDFPILCRSSQQARPSARRGD